MSLSNQRFWLLLLVVFGTRLLTLAGYPLMDTTEARYGEMARLMVETGNWLTPQFDYGVPFWGKPPMFVWMSASAMEFFGVNEFAARLPHWLAGAATLVLLGHFARFIGISWKVASLALASCGIFSVASGAVMTDMALTFSFTLAVIGFYRCWCGKRLWGYIGFTGLALGLLSKGPLILVLMGIVVIPWTLLQHGIVGAIKQLWQRIPLMGGTLLMLTIALPWYLMAEAATPGFIDYFILGEHFSRFLVSGWQGDLYGTAHEEAKGMIWLFWLEVTAPWSFVLLFLFIRWVRSPLKAAEKGSALTRFLVLWMVSPMLLFTLAGNILPAYVLPGVPALALLVAKFVEQRDLRWFSRLTLLVPLLLVIAMVVLNLGIADKRCDKKLLTGIDTDIPVFYVGKRPFSGQFYSQGQAKLLREKQQLDDLQHYYLIGKQHAIEPWLKRTTVSCYSEQQAASGRSRYLCQTR